jgi:uncharacterized NAD(P)/FAD-binding protein YdhS
VLNLRVARPAVGIIGGGASGALAALALLRSGADVDVVVIEPRLLLGRGVAYSTADPRHRLNVPAAGMSGVAGDPEHFVRWAWSVGAPVDGFSFPSRELYGSYLGDSLAEAADAGPGGLAHLRDTACGVRRERSGWTVMLAGGGRLSVDALVLALGYAPAAPPFGLPAELVDDRRFVADPWAAGAPLRPPAGGRVLLLGTGLTAVDAALTLSADDPRARITAISRHGLRPLDHRPGGVPSNPPVTAAVRPHTALGLLRSVRAEAALSAACGGDWRDVVNRLRPVTNDLWQSLPLTERHRFTHRLARFWEVHRHRLAPSVSDAARALEASRRLEFAAARVLSAQPGPDALRVELGLPGGRVRTLDAHLVVNCTGLTARVGGHPLLQQMAADGLCAPGPLGLGLAAADGQVLDRAGRPTGMYALGPLLRGELWETTAVPEIRDQAHELAEQLSHRLSPLALPTPSRLPA